MAKATKKKTSDNSKKDNGITETKKAFLKVKEKYVKFLNSILETQDIYGGLAKVERPITLFLGNKSDFVPFFIKYSDNYDFMEICYNVCPLITIDSNFYDTIDWHVYDFFNDPQKTNFEELPEYEYKDFIEGANNLMKSNVKSIADMCVYYLTRLITEKGWESLDEFIKHRFIPSAYIFHKDMKKTHDKGDFYSDNVKPLFSLFKEMDKQKVKSIKLAIDKYYEEYQEILNLSIFNLLKAIKQKDRKYIHRIMKEWDTGNAQVTPEKVIYNMAFPNKDPLDKPIPLKVSDIEKELRKNNCVMCKRAIQKLCDSMHIPRDKTKSGRPKSTNIEAKK